MEFVVRNNGFRVDNIPPYRLGDVAQLVNKARLAGEDIVDLSQFNPNLPPPSAAVDKLVQSALRPQNHRYSASQGISKLREAAAAWYADKFSVAVDPQAEVVVTLGTKEGLPHLLLSMLSHGDNVLVPIPSYPVHASAIFLAGGGFIGVPLFPSAEAWGTELSSESEAFFKSLDYSFNHTWPRPRVMVLSFPHNPTTTTATACFFERLIQFARAKNIFLIHDFAYADMGFDGYTPPSILQCKNAKEVAVEFCSLSKSFSMSGWRVGFCAGNERLVNALKRVKSFLDCGVFQPLQIGAIEALKRHREITAETASEYQARRDALVRGLGDAGWELPSPKATAFVWAKLPKAAAATSSREFAQALFEGAKVAVLPGGDFDVLGDSFVRFALSENESRIRLAVSRMKNVIG